jgi:hypothetical protein
MKSDGSCPTCGKVIGEPAGGAPWHFKLLMVALVAYLGFRAFQGVEGVLGRL